MSTKFRALIVDDSKVMRLMVMKGLRQAAVASFTFEEAGDGAEALERFDDEPFDIVFVDWNMPRMTGVEMVRAIRQERKNGSVAIVMISSEKSAAKIQEAVEDAGADAYITKPFNTEQIERKLKDVVERMESKTGDVAKAKKGLSRWLS